MNVLALPQTCDLGPSSRYRVYQLLPHLAKLGFNCTVSPAIDAPLYHELYLAAERRASRRAALGAIWKTRQADLERLDQFDLVLLQKAVLPGLTAFFEARIARRKPLVVDFDDAIWLPRQGGSVLARLAHRERSVQKVFRCATAVIAGNEFLAGYARRFNQQVTVVPSSLDTARFPQGHDTPVIGWIGSSTTLPYLKPLKTVFEQLAVQPRVIGSGDPTTLGFPVEFRPWRLETELAELAEIGIGIAPLPDTPWEQGKCGVKLLQYMACGIPVVASPVGVHRDIIRHGVNGFLAATTAEWIDKLSTLQRDGDLRRRLGQAGRATAQADFDIHGAAEKIAKILRAAAQRGSP